MSAERWSNSRVCAGLHSAPVRRSFDKEIGATRVVVVIFSPCRSLGDALGIRGIRSGGLLRSCCQNEFKEPEKIAHLRASDDKGRQQSQSKIVGAIDEQAALHGLADERHALHGEFDADHQAFAANFADEAELGSKLREELECNGTSQRAAAESGAVHPWRDARGDLLRGENGAERKSGGERLGDQNNVRLRGEFLIGEVTAGAPESALNFIGDQESAVLRGKRASSIPEKFADRIDPAFALYGFQKDATHGVVKFRLEIGDVVETHELSAGNNRREWQPVLFRGSNADGAESAPMKGVFQGQKTVLLRGCASGLVRVASEEARKLHCPVNGFRAAVRKKDAVHPGPSGEFARQRALIGVVIEIREVNGAGSFSADYFHDARVRVPERIYGDAAEKIEVLLASGIIDIGAAAVSHDHRLALVGGQKELLGIE